MGRFNGFLKSVILRVSEARDLGDVNRFQFYDHMKDFTAAPPDVLRIDEKYTNEHSILNCVGLILTTNYKTTGIYLPAEDRRHYVTWSNMAPEDFSDDYWNANHCGFRGTNLAACTGDWKPAGKFAADTSSTARAANNLRCPKRLACSVRFAKRRLPGN